MSRLTDPGELLHAMERPRPIDDRGFWDRVAGDPRLAAYRAGLETAAKKAGPLPALAKGSDLLARRWWNDRSRVDAAWLEPRRLFAGLMMRRVLAPWPGAEAVREQWSVDDDQLLDWIWAYLHAPAWTAHFHQTGTMPYPAEPVLDLAACETSGLLAELAEVLAPWLDAIGPEMREQIADVVEARILQPFVEGRGRLWWVDRAENNWAGVCGGSILAACESLSTQGLARPSVAAAREKAIEVINRFFAGAFTPSGESEEAVSYWGYGMTFATRGLMRLGPDELARRIDLDRLASIARYPESAHIFDETFYLRGDAFSVGHNLGRGWLTWLGVTTGQPWLIRWGASRPTPQLNRGWLPWREAVAVLHGPAVDDTLPAEPTQPFRVLVDQQVGIYRIAEGRVHATLAGGHNDMPHNHLDLGHVNVWVDHQPVLVDLGTQAYQADSFGPNRYGYLPNNTDGHNVLTVGGSGQAASRDAASRVIQLDAEAASLDLTGAYPAEAGLRAWRRTLRPIDRGVAIEDQVELTVPADCRLRWWSASPFRSAEAGGPGQAVFELGGAVMSIDSPKIAADFSTGSERAGDHFLRGFDADVILHRLDVVIRGDAFTVTTTIRTGS